MCTAFVNGIAATNASAATPCTHQLRKCAAAAVSPSTPIACSPWPTSQPNGAHFSNDGSVSAILQRLEQEAGHTEEQERADEDPVAHLVAPARIAG